MGYYCKAWLRCCSQFQVKQMVFTEICEAASCISTLESQSPEHTYITCYSFAVFQVNSNKRPQQCYPLIAFCLHCWSNNPGPCNSSLCSLMASLCCLQPLSIHRYIVFTMDLLSQSGYIVCLFFLFLYLSRHFPQFYWQLMVYPNIIDTLD